MIKVRFTLFRKREYWKSSKIFVFSVIPRIGEFINIENFFPDFLENNWETKYGIGAFLEVYQVVWKGVDLVDIDLREIP